MVWQVEIIIAASNMDRPSNYAWFIFSACLFVYSAHRIVGFTKLEHTIENRRIHLIRKFRKHIQIYAGLSLLALFYFAVKLSAQSIFLLSPPTLLAFAYITPVFGGRRFRDFPFIKVFIVAGVWAWTCVWVPFSIHGLKSDPAIVIAILEKFLFITAITIPFDIRDLEVDKSRQVKTIPNHWGVRNSLYLCVALLILSMGLVGLQIQLHFVEIETGIALIMSYLITVALVSLVNEKRHDYYFSAILDGTIILQFATVWFITAFFL